MKKGNRFRLAIIYILILLIIGLVGFLIYYIMNKNEHEKQNSETLVSGKAEKEKISDNCIFEVPYASFNKLNNNVSALMMCEGYNKLILNDIDFTKVYVIYYNGFLQTDSKKYGIYINDKQVTVGASFDHRNLINVFDNLIFIKKENMQVTNVLTYNDKGRLVYDLQMALARTKIVDKAFKEMGNTKNTIVSLKNIDINSYEFKQGEFTFETTSECASGQQYKGSSYKVTYQNNKFNAPEFVNYVKC